MKCVDRLLSDQTTYASRHRTLGGSFDPVHNGHLAVARGALEALRLQRVDFVLAPRPWQKSVATPVWLRLKCFAQPSAKRTIGSLYQGT